MWKRNFDLKYKKPRQCTKKLPSQKGGGKKSKNLDCVRTMHTKGCTRPNPTIPPTLLRSVEEFVQVVSLCVVCFVIFKRHFFCPGV